MRVRLGCLTGIAAVLGVIALIIYALLPSPVRVETGVATRGPMRVTIDEDGEARAHDRFVISAPVSGKLRRVELHDGDSVGRDAVVALIEPVPLGPKEKGELQARLQSSEALRQEAFERIARVRVEYEQANRDLDRGERLARAGLISTQEVEQTRNAVVAAREELRATLWKADAAASDVRLARASLIALDHEAESSERLVTLRSPVSGRVLRVTEKSERVVGTGTPLITIGDPNKIEIVIDVLSTDAVKIKPGAPVIIDNWGGEQVIRARVRMIEASAFTKISALGVEEQRVNIVADFVEPPGRLGDGYRIEASIVIWETNGVLKVPSSAVFRHGHNWSVFVVENGRATRREVEIGHRNTFEAEIIDGIQEGSVVVLHPNNQIRDGGRVEEALR